MKLNKACPAHDYCKASNEKMDAVWRYGCPKWIGAKKTAPFDQCMRHEEWRNAIRNDSRPPGERP